MSDEPIAFDDGSSLAGAVAVAKYNCRGLLIVNAARVQHFVRRIAELGRSPADTAIVVINVDDPHGAIAAEALMPGHDWNAYRARGETPIGRGLVERPGIQEMLDAIDPAAALKFAAAEVPVLVVDQGVVEVFEASEARQ